MGKELESLYKIGHTCCLNCHNIKYGIIDDDPNDRDCKDMEEMAECLNTVEEALKDYESRKVFLDNVDNNVVVFEPKEVWEEKNKKLKALEIIKSKEVDVSWFKYCLQTRRNDTTALRAYNANGDIEITVEEYELLKEVLKDE